MDGHGANIELPRRRAAGRMLASETSPGTFVVAWRQRNAPLRRADKSLALPGTHGDFGTLEIAPRLRRLSGSMVGRGRKDIP